MTAARAASADPQRRVKILLVAGLGLVAVFLLVTKVFGGGGGGANPDEAFAQPTVKATPTTVAPAAEAVPGAPGAPAPVETFEVFTTKNPFKSLRDLTPSAPAAAKAPVAAPAATPLAPAIIPVAVAPAAVATTATGGQATEPVRSTRIALLDVFAEGDRVVANVRVNDTVSKVGAGDAFAGNFKVVSLDAGERCGRFLFGDDQFRLCRGEEALK